MTLRWRHPIHAMPFDAPVANALAEEHRERPRGSRWQLLRKAAGRELALLLNGQARRRVRRAPAPMRRMLWVYTWTTVGDAILDLSPRALVPASIEIDLLIAPPLAPLFATDRFRTVCSEPAACASDYDFILLDSLRTTSLRMKAERFAGVPFATMRDHHAGERFDRAAFADLRLRQLFDLPDGPVATPRLELAEARPERGGIARFRVAVPFGARVANKRYRHWADVLAALIERWPNDAPAPLFWLLGAGRSAQKQVEQLDVGFLVSHCTRLVDSGSLRKTAVDIAACDAFLGVDGGLMHVAVAVGTPGLALFTQTDPIYFLRPGSSMTPLVTAGPLDELPAEDVARAFLDRLPAFTAAR